MAFPIEQSGRSLGMYDPKTREYTPINTCFGTHHLNFAEDADNTLWFCGGGQVVGWFNTKVYDATKDVAKAQGWTVLVLDTNGNGRRDEYVEPDQAVDPAKDKRISAPFYGVSTTPDGAVWGSVTGSPGGVVRLSPGPNPPSTALAEYFEVPWSVPSAQARDGFGPRGFDVDRNGVAWLALASGHMASFDRRKCRAPLNGPAATGKHCAEGWTLYPLPGPQLKGVAESGSAVAPYYAWVDQFDTFGAGRNVPFATGNAMEAMVAVIDGQVRTFRIPYPLGFYGKGADGRIDDPKAGWKGKGMYTTYATRAPFHSEGGMGTTSKVVKLQLRPNPLAR
jgi:streptogramin lyase